MIIERLFLHGEEENYIVFFKKGLNIIYGDSDKGKTTILELIKYFLGGDEVQLGQEIKTKVKRCFLEIKIDDSNLTIERDIFNKNALIKVSKEKVEDILANKVNEYNFYTINEDENFERFSDFLLKLLKFPIGKIRKGPSKDSQLQSITIRSIFKYCYLTQDEIGSKKLLNLDYPIKLSVNIQILKYIYKVLDMEIETLQDKKQKMISLKNIKELEFETINNFLDDTGIDNLETIRRKIKELEEELDINLIEKEELDELILKENETSKETRDTLKEEYKKSKEIDEVLNKLFKEEEEFYLLIDEYKKELKKIEIAIRLGKSIGSLSKELYIECKCPICSNSLEIKEVKEKFEVEDTEFLINERKKIKSKYKNIELYIENINVQKDQFTKKKIENEKKIEKLEKLLNFESKKFIAP